MINEPILYALGLSAVMLLTIILVKLGIVSTPKTPDSKPNRKKVLFILLLAVAIPVLAVKFNNL